MKKEGSLSLQECEWERPIFLIGDARKKFSSPLLDWFALGRQDWASSSFLKLAKFLFSCLLQFSSRLSSGRQIHFVGTLALFLTRIELASQPSSHFSLTISPSFQSGTANYHASGRRDFNEENKSLVKENVPKTWLVLTRVFVLHGETFETMAKFEAPERMVCCTLCMCMAVAVFSSVALVYLTALVYMPAKREINSGLSDVPVVCTTVQRMETDDCDWYSCGEWCLSKSSHCVKLWAQVRRNGTDLELRGCQNIHDITCMVRKRHCTLVSW